MTKIEIAKAAKRRHAKVLAQRKKRWTLEKIASVTISPVTGKCVSTARISAMLKKARED